MNSILKITTALLIASLIFACGNSNEENPENTDSAELSVDTMITETAKNEIEFNTFEDYADIKSKEALTSLFDEQFLKDDINYYAEGTVEMPVTILTNPTNNHIITFVWDDDFKTNSIEASYFIYDDEYNEIGQQKIETNEGLFLGMTIEELKDWNGADFSFSGFGWDYGGSIFADEDSRISNSSIIINLQSNADELEGMFLGDVEVKTDHPKLKDAKVIVSSFDLMVAQ
jgi:hypothetical protein